MTDENRTLITEEAMDEQIVAYLDGELDREAALAIERRGTTAAHLQHQPHVGVVQLIVDGR